MPVNDDFKGNKEFYLDDYNSFSNQCRGWEVDLITFCFLSKNFDESFPLVNEAIEAMLTDDLLNILKKESHPVGRQFMQFQNEFFQGMYKVKKNRVTDPAPADCQK